MTYKDLLFFFNQLPSHRSQSDQEVGETVRPETGEAQSCEVSGRVNLIT